MRRGILKRAIFREEAADGKRNQFILYALLDFSQ